MCCSESSWHLPQSAARFDAVAELVEQLFFIAGCATLDVFKSSRCGNRVRAEFDGGWAVADAEVAPAESRLNDVDCPMEKNVAPFTWIDWCLSVAIAGLSILLLALLCEPAVGAWLNRPRPGVQVAQQYLAGQVSGADSGTPIDYLVYLPPEYDGKVKWPLVVFLHGAGERGEDLEKVSSRDYRPSSNRTPAGIGASCSSLRSAREIHIGIPSRSSN